MKVFIVISLTILLSLCVESAQPIKRGDSKNSNLAVVLAYRPNTEIRTRDKTSNKSWTYDIDNESAETVNEELLEALIQDRFAKRFMTDDKKFVKRENAKDDSHETHEDVDVNEPIEIVDKKACYKNTYQNVLTAFESALKSQIDNYKKCVCQKKTTTTTTTTTTTEAPTPAPRNLSEEKLDLGNEETILSAMNNRDDIICFHKQHAFMLNKLLDKIPCKENAAAPDQTDLKEFKGATKKRAERNNIPRHHESESESVEIDVSELTPRPQSTTSKPSKAATAKGSKKSVDEDENNLNEKILAFLKDHMGAGKDEKTVQKKSTKVQTAPKKIKIKPRQVEQIEEESEEISHQVFLEQLQEMIAKYQPESDETFPLQSGEHSAESTSRLSTRQSPKKSSASSRNAVAEHSDESTEAFIRLKSRKLEKERLQLSENARKSSSTANHVNVIDDNSIDSHPKKSYRNSPRTTVPKSSTVRSSTARTTTSRSTSSRASSKPASSRTSTDDERDYSSEEKDVQTSHHKKNSQKNAKSSRTSFDDRLAADLAKKISDFARGKSPKKA